jgi:hypothetical protein
MDRSLASGHPVRVFAFLRKMTARFGSVAAGALFGAWIGATAQRSPVARAKEAVVTAADPEELKKPPLGSGEETVSGIYANFFSAAIPAIVVLFPLLLIGVLAGRDVFAAILWRGNVTALSLGLVPLMLPLLAVSASFLILHRLRSWHSQDAWRASTWWLILLLAVPPTVGLAQAGLIFFGIVPRSRRRRLILRSACAVLIAGGVALGTVPWSAAKTAGQDGQDAGWASRIVLGQLFGAMPKEIITTEDGHRAAYFVVQVDDSFTTVVSSYPPIVKTIKNDKILDRTPCRNRPSAVQRSLISTMAGTGSKSVECDDRNSEKDAGKEAYVVYSFIVLCCLAGLAVSVRYSRLYRRRRA